MIIEPRREKPGLRGFRPGPTQTGLYKYRSPEACNFGFNKRRDCTIRVAKTKASIRFAVTGYKFRSLTWLHRKFLVHVFASWTICLSVFIKSKNVFSRVVPSKIGNRCPSKSGLPSLCDCLLWLPLYRACCLLFRLKLSRMAVLLVGVGGGASHSALRVCCRKNILLCFV